MSLSEDDKQFITWVANNIIAALTKIERAIKLKD